ILLVLTPLPSVAVAAGISVASVVLLGFGFVVALAVWRGPTLKCVTFVNDILPFRLGARLKLDLAAQQFAQGTDSLRYPSLWMWLLVWTGLTWLCSLASGWAGARALDVQASLAMVLWVTVAASVSQAVPSSPGYVGVYHAAAYGALTFF